MKKKKFVLSAVFLALFLALIYIVKNVDLATTDVTEIGLAHINNPFHELFGENLILYDITQVIGYICLLICVFFAFFGLYQLIKRKNLWKVDVEILCLGGLYAVVIGMYVFFEFCIVNCRPIIMSGETEAEASFPSSHTVLICVVMISLIMIIGKYIKNKKLEKGIRIFAELITVFTVVSRTVCGVHWLTDIIGGILITTSLLLLFSGILESIKWSIEKKNSIKK